MKVANLTASGALAQQGQERDGDNRAFQKCAISSLTHRTRLSRLKKKNLWLLTAWFSQGHHQTYHMCLVCQGLFTPL